VAARKQRVAKRAPDAGAKPKKKKDKPKAKEPPRVSAERSALRPRRTSRPPAAWASRCKSEAWPFTPWLAENKDVAAAQDAMLISYFIADLLGDPGLSDAQRRGLRSAVESALPMLRRADPAAGAWAVACAVRRNGGIMLEVQRAERRRFEPGAVLDALLEAHEDEAAHLVIEEVRLHSAELGSWLEELERRKRPELRNALRAVSEAPWAPASAGPNDALRRLLVLVAFAVDQLRPPFG
jgi:hypothetical protein